MDRGSPETADIRLPISYIKSLAASPRSPNVSTAIGTKTIDGDSDVAYLFRFRSSASFATAPIPDEARFKRLGASVSGQVKSHARHLPSFHGINDMPSGRFWLLLSL